MSLSTSILTAGPNNFATTSEHLNNIPKDLITQGIIGAFTNNQGSGSTGAFGMDAQGSPNNTVNVRAGVAYVTATPSTQRAQLLRVEALTDQTVTFTSNGTGSTVYDWVYIKIDTALANSPDANGTTVATLFTSRSTSSTTDNGTPPATGLLLSVVTLPSSFTTITNSQIAGRRTASTLVLNAALAGYTGGLIAPTTVVANGHRNYTLTFPLVNYTQTLSAGMRLKLIRTAAAPVQCTSLDGTTQYFNRTATINGMTFTNNFVVSAWIKLNSYPGSTGTIAARFNGTSGWAMRVGTNGQVEMFGTNAGSGNFKDIVSGQPVPLNKWVHVAAQLDMTSSTNSPTVNYIMFDGLDIPATQTSGGTAPTSLIQAGNLEIGSSNGGAALFPGKIAQVAIYSAKVTQAAILASINQGLTGSETSLVSAYSFNNSINDLNVGNANNLTANGSATATNADSPFGTQADGTISASTEYATVTSVSFSTNTTVKVQAPRGNAIPTSGGLSGVSYSSQNAPFGFPNTLFSGLTQVTTNWNAPTLSASEQDLASCGLSLGVWAPIDCIVNADVALGVSSTSDFEFQPEIRVDGVVVGRSSLSAAIDSAAARGVQRGVSWGVALTAGYHTISAGVYIAAGAGWSMPPGAGQLRVFTPLQMMA